MVKKIFKILFPVSFATAVFVFTTAEVLLPDNLPSTFDANTYDFTIKQGISGLGEEVCGKTINFVCKTKTTYLSSKSNEEIEGKYFINTIENKTDAYKNTLYRYTDTT
jgi:hypothetical protein